MSISNRVLINSLQAERLDWFRGLESLAVRIKLDVIELDVACIYQSTALVNIKDNSKLMCALENMPINNERELLLVEKFIAPPSSQTVKEADLGRVLSINHQFLKLQIYNPTKTLKRPISTTKIKH